jgi:phage recombination protein Bet
MATTSALVVRDASASAIIAASGFDRAQVELVKSTVAVGATDMELALFLQTAKHRGLDVFARQLHFVKRKQRRQDPTTGVWGEVMVGTMQTGIDGFRLIADRTGKYDGQDEPEYEYEPDGKTLRRASVRIFRKDIPRPFVGTAYWREYADFDNDGRPRAMWKRMPHVMLAKCAEALALRKAFPENLSGLYTDDEMPAIEAEAIVHETPAAQPTGTVTRIDRAAPPASEPVTTGEEIPPADADGSTLRVWLGRRLGFRTNAWKAEHMANACGEVARALGLAEGTVTPKTLGEHLPKYRDEIARLDAAKSGRQDASPDESGTTVATIPETTPAVDSAPAATALDAPTAVQQEMIDLLTEHGLANDDPAVRHVCQVATQNSPAGPQTDWHELLDDELRVVITHLRDALSVDPSR